MAQVKLIDVKKTEKGFEVKFQTLDGKKEMTGIYTNSNLSFEKLSKLIGHQISYNDKHGLHIHKAWGKHEGEEIYTIPVHCDDSNKGFDRAE